MIMPLPRTPSFRLDGKAALVVGASSGIGLGAAVALAEAGAQVTLAARSADKLADTVEAIRSEGFHAQALELDIQDVETVETVVAKAGPFDVLVNSAGLARHGPAVVGNLSGTIERTVPYSDRSALAPVVGNLAGRRRSHHHS
jgi:NADP-dependent 3-hydroxy acid dehydrogenase YdfG